VKKLIAIVFLTAVFFQSSAEEKKIWAKSLLNQKGPQLTVEKWLTAEPKVQGKFVLVDFWATWCGPCKRSIPELNRIHQKFKDRVVVIGISNEKEEVVRKFNDPAISYAVAVDTQSRLLKQLEIKGIPHVILMDPKGIVRWEGLPTLPGYELTEKVVQEVLAKYGKE
jgi:cytochrome c biogenesis protein CcmG/thiol:disulfide interchange protein DsbE